MFNLWKIALGWTKGGCSTWTKKGHIQKLHNSDIMLESCTIDFPQWEKNLGNTLQQSYEEKSTPLLLWIRIVEYSKYEIIDCSSQMWVLAGSRNIKRCNFVES